MVKPRQLIEESEGEEYLHKVVCHVVQRQIDYAEASPKGSIYDDLIAMVFAFHAVEGYLNYIEEKIAPDHWRDEKAKFSEGRITGKLAAICECCGLAPPDYGKRPYGTVSELKKLRNAVAHPRTRKIGGTIKYDERKPPPLFQRPYLSTIVDHKRAVRARDDVKDIADKIHAAACEKYPSAGLVPDALGGIVQIRTSTIRLSKGD